MPCIARPGTPCREQSLPLIRADSAAILRCMPRVGRASPSSVWRSWAATRHDLVALMEELIAVAGDAMDTPAAGQIRLREFERPFRDGAEFLENVDEREWTRQTVQWQIEVQTSADGPSLLLVGERGGDVHLSLYGGARHQRNAVTPDIAEAVGKYARKGPPRKMFIGVVAILAAATMGLGLWGFRCFWTESSIGQSLSASEHFLAAWLRLQAPLRAS